jgi:hypothetical protein
MKRKGISNILLRKHEYESVVIWFYFSKKKTNKSKNHGIYATRKTPTSDVKKGRFSS